MASGKNASFSKQHVLISIFSRNYICRPCCMYALHNFASSNGLFSFPDENVASCSVGVAPLLLHFAFFNEPHKSLICRAAAAAANPRHRWIIRNAEGIETMAHRGQPSWAGRLPAHRLQFRFAILNSPEDEYTFRESSARKNDNARIRRERRKK